MRLNYILYRTTNQKPLDESKFGSLVPDSGPRMIEHNFDDGYGSIYFDSPITKINRNAFVGQTTLKVILLPDTVKVIDAFAFACCYNLDMISTQSVENIEDFAFLDCNSLRFITIYENVKKLGINAFSGCPDRSQIIIDNTHLNYNDIKDGFGPLHHGRSIFVNKNNQNLDDKALSKLFNNAFVHRF